MSEKSASASSTHRSIAVEARMEEAIAPLSHRSDDESHFGRKMITCPSCSHPIKLHGQGQIHELLGLPAGVKFDPTDQEILEYLEARIMEDGTRLHPLINQFIPTIEDDSGISYTHPENLPGMRSDGQICHFFHRLSKAYATGTRTQRKVITGVDTDDKSWWHKTGKNKSFLVNGKLKGFKEIHVLYTNPRIHNKLEKTNWVMHQFHLGDGKEKKDGEFVISKVFYQTQRQCQKQNDDKKMEATTSSRNGQRLPKKRPLEGHNSYDQTEGDHEPISGDQDGGTTTGPITLQLFPNPVV